jgi:hypothetical protein
VTAAASALSGRPTLPGWTIGVLVLAVLGVSFVLISLATWVFQPLAWASTALSWTIRFHLRSAESKEFPAAAELPAVSGHARDRARQAVKALADAHANISKASAGLRKTFDDTILVAGFARKFLVSLVHVGILFGLVHYALNSGDVSPGTRYSGLAHAPFLEAWPGYLYFAMMTLMGGDSGILPIEGSSRLAVLLNALAGVVFLVILITMFSMVSRDRTQSAAGHLRDAAVAALTVLEKRALHFMVMAAGSRSLTDDLTSDFARLHTLEYLTRSEASTYRGILLFHRLARAVDVADRSADLATVSAIRARLPLSGYAEFHDRVLQLGKADTDTLLSALIAVAANAVPQSGAT